MLILPERGIRRGKILMPLRPSEWRAPSQRQTTFGIENELRWVIEARLQDGYRVWRGFFDDREDLDAFLWAMARGTLLYERSLWDMPNPAWRPDLGEQLSYYIFGIQFLVSPTGSNQTFTSPVDWNNGNNSVECIGGGGGGKGGQQGSGAGAGGGAGAYSKILNFTFAVPGTTTATYQIGALGAGGSVGGGNGGTGGDSWFNGATFGASSVGAKGGAGSSSQTVAGSGGSSGSGIGTTLKSGGSGGTTTGGVTVGGGGGGAGSVNGDGAQGGNYTGALSSSSGGPGGGGSGGGTAGGSTTTGTTPSGAGGNNFFGSGGAAGVASGSGGNGSNGGGGSGGAPNGQNGGNGGNGTEWDASHGSGGGGGASTNAATSSGTGGLYGGAGAGGGATSAAGATPAGAGGQGIVVASWTPVIYGFEQTPTMLRRYVRGADLTSTPKADVETPLVVPFREGWAVQPPQPPHPKPERGGAFMPKEDGIEAPFIFIPPGVGNIAGWEVQPPQPPNPTRVGARMGALLPGDASDFNDQSSPLVQFFPMGWEIQPGPPPRFLSFPNVRAGAVMRGDDGNYGLLRSFFPLGFPIQPPQPPHPTPEKRAAATMRGDDGNQNLFFLKPFPEGWKNLDFQPPHPRPERAGAIMPIEPGIEAPYIFTPPAILWETNEQHWQPPTLRYRQRGAILRGIDGIEATEAIVHFGTVGWVVQPWQPPHWPRIRFAGAIMRGDDGIGSPFFAARMSFDLAPQVVLRRRIVSFDQGLAEIVTPFPQPVWWDSTLPDLHRKVAPFFLATSLVEVLPPQPDEAAWAFDRTELFYRPRARPEAALDAEPFAPLVTRVAWGYDSGPSLILRRRPLITIPAARNEETEPSVQVPWGSQDPVIAPVRKPRRAIFDRGYELITNFPPVWTDGWQIQPPQPPRPRWPRASAIMRGLDGTEAPFILEHFGGWDPVLFWPPHPRPERTGSVMLGDISGAWGPFVYLVPSGAIASDFAYWIAVPFDIGQPP